MISLDTYRRVYADEIRAVANLRSPALVEALATVPRETFLPPGPWTIRSEADLQGPPRRTADDDPRQVCHNVAVAIDADRQLFNGAPSVVAMAVDALGPAAGARVLHLGVGLGYYTAILADVVGPHGEVVAVEVDPILARRAAANLVDRPQVTVHEGDGRDPLPGRFDAILINAGVTHPLPWWLDALAPGGRLLLPLTASAPGMATIGKGPMVLLAATGDPARLSARITGFVAIYSALGLRDAAINAALAQTLTTRPLGPVVAARRDVHEREASCWLHIDGCCLTSA